MSVYTFGDKIPGGDDNDLFVSYNIDGFPGGMLSGPYKDMTQAIEELKDIRGYEGVKEATLVRRHELVSS